MLIQYLKDGSIRTIEFLTGGNYHITIYYQGKKEVDYIS